jgi:2-keto-3-deoxy-L-rhamnonate aldolase RhmA
MKQPNRVKAAMRAGRKAYGYNLSFPSPWVIDILGKLDFDFVFIDGEHGPFGLDQLEDLCRTAERHNVTTIARVPDIGSSTILRYLDRGIMGILGPHIATEVDARQLVRACYFGPLGERSFGANRGTDYNAGIADKAAYYREANEQMLVCALLEDVAVPDNLDAILSVPGIDLYSIGPNDFAQSLGYPGQPDHPEVVKTIQEITRRIRQAGRRMQLDVMQGAWVSICCSTPVVVFYHRSVGERCSSIRHRLDHPQRGWLFKQRRSASPRQSPSPTSCCRRRWRLAGECRWRPPESSA